MTRSTGPPTKQAARRQFASDNYAGICPEAWDALRRRQRSHAPAYGDDALDRAGLRRAPRAVRDRLRSVLRLQRHRGQRAGPGLALPVVSQHHLPRAGPRRDRRMRRAGVLLQRHEAAARRGAIGKVEPAVVEPLARKRCDIHYPKPRAVSITQATELGTVYTPDELQAPRRHVPATRPQAPHGRRALRQRRRVARRRAEGNHLAGRRRRALLRRHEERPRARRSGGVLRSRAGRRSSTSAASRPAICSRRCASSPPRGSGCWRAAPGSAMPSTPMPHGPPPRRRDRKDSRRRDHAARARPTRSSSACSPSTRDALRDRGWRFYDFIGAGGARLMCSWDTTDADVDALVADLRVLAQ